MGAYGIFLRVFNLISHALAALTLARYVELKMRREIPCLQAAMYSFIYYINTWRRSQLYSHFQKENALPFTQGDR